MRGRLFGPGISGSGELVEGEWQGDRIRLRLPSGELTSGELTVAASGFNLSELRFCWQGELGGYAFCVVRAESKPLVDLAPESLQAALQRATRGETRLGRRLSGAVIVAILLVILLASGAWVGLVRISDALVNRLEPAEEARLGELVLAQTRVTTELFDSGPAIDAIGVVGAQLTPGSRLSYRYYLARNPELNAFAAPGGIVVVNSGLVAATDQPEELAGVLAHEVAHAELRHATRMLVRSIGLRGLLRMLFRGFDPSYAPLAARFTELKFSRDAEREADAEGLARLRAAGINEGAMLEIFEKLAQQNELAPPAWLSTHPNIHERLAWLRSQPRSARATTPLAIDWSAVKAALPK